MGNERPIYYSTTVAQKYYKEINKYLLMIGLAYKIGSIDNGSSKPITLDPNATDFLLDKFDFSGVVYDSKLLTQRMSTNYIHLIIRCLEKSDREQAIQLLNLLTETDWPKTESIDRMLVYSIKHFFELDRTNEGLKMVKEIVARNPKNKMKKDDKGLYIYKILDNYANQYNLVELRNMLIH